MDATAKLVAIVALVAFATERIRTGASYLIEAEERIRRIQRDADDERVAHDRRRILLVALGAAIALVAVDLIDLRVLRLMQSIPRFSFLDRVDYWLTWLVIFAGADRIRELLQGAAPAKKDVPTVRVKVDNEGKVSELKQAS
jgi:hypothetical protein